MALTKFKSSCKSLEPYMLLLRDKIKSAEKKCMTEQFKTTQRLPLRAADRKCEQQLMVVTHILQQIESICRKG